jgi:hypothetical protein
MSQNRQNECLNSSSFAQDFNRKNDESHYEDEAFMENEAIAEPLSNEELVNVSGGATEEVSDVSHQEVRYRLVEKRSSLLEPGPTFPAPPRSEDSL